MALSDVLHQHGLSTSADANVALLATLGPDELKSLRHDLAQCWDDQKAAPHGSAVEASDIVDALQAVSDTEVDTRESALVAAGATPTSGMPSLSSLNTPAHQRPNVDRTATVMVSDTGEQLSTDDVVSKMVAAYDKSLNDGTPRNPERVSAVTLETPYPEDRTLGSDVHANDRLLNDVLGPNAILASGGFCGPPAGKFDIAQVLPGAQRPVRDALPNYQATRGQVSYTAAPKLADVASGAAVWTWQTDTTPGGSTKAAVRATCPGVQTTKCDAIYRALVTGNFDSRAYPERLEALLTTLLGAHARVAENNALGQIGAASVSVTTSQVMGAYRDWIPAVGQAAAGMRSRSRHPEGLGIRVLAPRWARDLIKNDINRQPPGDSALAVTDAEVDAMFAQYGVRVTWYADSQSGENQIFGGQASSDLGNYPGAGGGITRVTWYIFAEGTFVFLDGGVLELGLIRDVALSSVNDVEFFGETFEATAFVGNESYKVRSTLCASGLVPSASSSSAYCNAS